MPPRMEKSDPRISDVHTDDVQASICARGVRTQAPHPVCVREERKRATLLMK